MSGWELLLGTLVCWLALAVVVGLAMGALCRTKTGPRRRL